MTTTVPTCAGCGKDAAPGTGGWRHVGLHWLCAGCPGWENLLELVTCERFFRNER